MHHVGFKHPLNNMNYIYPYSSCIEIILCELTYDYIIYIGFDFYWIIEDKLSGIKHLYPVFYDDNVFNILVKNRSLLVRTNDIKMLQDIKEDQTKFILHLPEQINQFHKEKSP